MAKRIRKRAVDPDRVRSRLYDIVLTGEDKDAVNAARVLLREQPEVHDGPDGDLLAQLATALRSPDL